MIRKYKMRFSASAFLWTLLSLLVLVIGFRVLFVSFVLGVFTLVVGLVLFPFADEFVGKGTSYVLELKLLLLAVLAIIFIFVVSNNSELHQVIWHILG